MPTIDKSDHMKVKGFAQQRNQSNEETIRREGEKSSASDVSAERIVSTIYKDKKISSRILSHLTSGKIN